MKMPARTRRPIQMMPRRRLNGLDCIMFLSLPPSVLSSSLREKLIEKRLEHVVADDAGIRIRLAFAMKDSGGRLVDTVGLAEREVLVNGSVQRAAPHKGAHFDHSPARKHAHTTPTSRPT